MRLCLIAAVVLLSACQLALPGKKSDVPVANPIAGGAITVTPLEPPPTEPAPVPAVGEPVPDPVPDPGPEPETEPAAQPEPPPPPPKSAAQIACEKRKGTWVKAGKTGTMTCQHLLRDSGKQCSRDRDCEGQCLARSRTCAPFTPLFGCNEVLQDNGQRVTLCID